jgi:imidazolonepropionase
LLHSLLLRGARQLLTLRGDPCVRRGPQSSNLSIIEDGSVFIQGGKIISVGPTRRVENLKETQGAIEIPLSNSIVMPGFVDSSMQVSLLNHTDQGKTLGRRRKLREFYNDSLLLLRSCLSHGTLNAGICVRSGLQSINADLSLLRQLTRIGNTPIGLTRIWYPETDSRSDASWTSAWETISRQRLADSITLKTPVPLRPSTRVNLDWVGGPVKELRERLESLRPGSVFCHHDLSATERKVLAKSAAAAVFKAGGSLLDSLPVSSVRELVDDGGAIALGSGYDALCEPNFNMQLVLAMAVRRLHLTIEEAIVATTINAAYAMNRGEQIGSLEPGKRADILILNLSDYREIPRRLGVNHVAMAIRNGEIVINRTKWKVGAA